MCVCMCGRLGGVEIGDIHKPTLLSRCRQLENVNGTVYLPVLYINQVYMLLPYFAITLTVIFPNI